MHNLRVFPIPAFTDNYIWCIENGQDCWVVDPGESEPVLSFCSVNNLALKGILVTHHHWDHTNGIETLLHKYPDIPVLGPAYGNIKHLTEKLKEGDRAYLREFDLSLEVIEVPGHTLDHIAYFGDNLLFCGDTLFSAGCGRLFEGSPEQMHHSLNKLMQLPGETVVYCTHEYTLANVQFALQVEPHNTALTDYANWAREKRSQGLPTLPSNIEQQKAINPFLRAQQDEIKHNAEGYLGKTLSDEVQVFAAIRQWKDNF